MESQEVQERIEEEGEIERKIKSKYYAIVNCEDRKSVIEADTQHELKKKLSSSYIDEIELIIRGKSLVFEMKQSIVLM